MSGKGSELRRSVKPFSFEWVGANPTARTNGVVAKLADAADLKSAIFGYEGSSPSIPTTFNLTPTAR